jgi:hypothetical protein
MLEYLLRRELQSLRKAINRLGLFVDIKNLIAHYWVLIGFFDENLFVFGK